MSHFNDLLQRYLNNEASEADRQELMKLIDSGKYDEFLKGSMEEMLKTEFSRPAAAHETEVPGEVRHKADEIFNQITRRDKTARGVTMRPAWRTIRWAAAAAIIGTVLLIRVLTPPPPVNDFMKKTIAEAFKKEANEGRDTTVIVLPDNSHVTLYPGASLLYPEKFINGRREVFLTGDAFFEVSEDKEHPFFVFSNTVITRVVGTSFTVRTTENKDTESEVAVRTGKVIVQENPGHTFLGRIMPIKEQVVLTRNLKAVYEKDAETFTIALVDKPIAMADDNQGPADFAFNATPIPLVLKRLEKAYGIEIETQNPDIDKCSFTADLSGEELYTQLELICQSVGATYEIKNAKILIRGKGCLGT